MWKGKILIILILLFHTTLSEASVELILSTDTNKHFNKVDSSIIKIASKSKFSYWIFKNIYEQPSPDAPPIDQKSSKPVADPLQRWKGKVIRNVYIKTLDPFGTDVDDTLLSTNGRLEKVANRVSINTRKNNIRNQLLFKKGERLDPLSLRESERLLRRQEYIRDARIIVPASTKKRADTVDVIVIVQDRWSINGSIGASATSTDFNVTESNLLGTGTSVKQGGRYDLSNLKFSNWSGEIKDVNIRKSYIDGSLFYDISPNTRWHGINFERTFYSPLTKWAGSAGATRYNNSLEFIQPDGAIIPSNLTYNISDFWLGRSLPVSNLSEAGRSSSLVLSVRYVRTNFVDKPSLNLDTLNSYQNRRLYLFSLGFSSRRYYKDKKIFRFGNTEDVPEGRSFNIVGGVYNEGILNYIYTGFKIAAGQHIESLGYLSGSTQYGVFYNDYIASRGVITFDGTYFSDLWKLGSWNMRQFVYLQATNGLNRNSGEYTSINGRGTDGLYGFNSFAVLGRNKTILKFESIFYTPFYFAGVQVAVVGFAGFGKIGRPIFPYIDEKKIYQAYGVGFLLRKENLVVNTIQVSFGFYPNIPQGTGSNFKYNPTGINNLNLRDFDVPRPELVNYR